jgi:hypothetical protein
MITNFPIDIVMMAILAGLVCATIFITGTHFSSIRLCLLLLISILICSFIPAARSVLGPGPASDEQGNIIKGTDGKPLYDRKAINQWSRKTAAEDGTLMLAGFVGGISIILLILRGLQCYWETRDS